MNEPPRLSLRVQAGYSTADIGLNTTETLLRLYLLVFYTDVVGLSASLAGIAAAIAIAWDALTDPIMGVISDRTRHRFGGRRGWLPLGGVLLAVGTVSVFWPPVAWLDSQAAKFTWLLLANCFLNVGLTVLSVPYMAMAGELTDAPHLRTALFGWRFAFANMGALLAAALPRLFLAADGTVTSVMPEVGMVTAGVVIATAMCSWVATRRVGLVLPPLPRDSLGTAFLVPLQNPTFRPLLLAYVVANLGIGVNAATFFYYYEHVLELPETQTLNVLALFVLVFTGSILGWVKVARTWGKRLPLMVGSTVLGIGTTFLYLLVPVGGYAWVLWLGAIGLGSFVGCIVLIDSMLTDVLDHDHLHSRALRSGAFFGVWRFAGKLVRALSLVTVGVAIDVAGFGEQGAAQPPAVDTVLVVLFGPVVGGLFVLTAVILWRYRFRESEQARVRRLLLRRAARADP